jgi:hypothetical protein
MKRIEIIKPNQQKAKYFEKLWNDTNNGDFLLMSLCYKYGGKKKIFGNGRTIYSLTKFKNTFKKVNEYVN